MEPSREIHIEAPLGVEPSLLAANEALLRRSTETISCRNLRCPHRTCEITGLMLRNERIHEAPRRLTNQGAATAGAENLRSPSTRTRSYKLGTWRRWSGGHAPRFPTCGERGSQPITGLRVPETAHELTE